MRHGVKVDRPLLYQEVVNEIYRLIDLKEICEGEKFPSERELTEQWQVSRNVLREAFHILENRGIIVARQGKGRFLRALPQKEDNVATGESISRNLERYSLLEIYEVRQTLEVQAVQLIIRNANDDDIDELSKACGTLCERFNRTGRTTGEFELHRLYASKTYNVFLEQMIGLVLDTVLDMMRNTFHDIMDVHHPAESIVQHQIIIDAIKKRDEAAGTKAMFNHIQATIDMLS